VRFDLEPWCEFGTDELDEIVLSFAEPVDPARVMIDTIEFTDVPQDLTEGSPRCGIVGGGGGGMWRCEIDALAVVETSCNGEPTGSPATCDAGDVVTDPVAPPSAVVPGDAFDGWAVHTRPGMIFDLDSPTSEEVEFVLDRCVQACELEYANDPEVAANCAAADAFFTPSLLAADSHASYYQFPQAEIHGGGLFEGESLDCDLRTDCCEAFDEDLCAVRPLRVTEARQGLGRGEEWSYGTAGIITIESSYAEETVQGTLTGTLGGSLCQGGNASAPCPSYIGSATLELDEAVTLALQCDGQTITHELQSLSLSLAQPAFAIMSHEFEVWSAFPAHGMVFDAHTEVDGASFDTFLPSDHGVGFMFDAGWANIPAYGKFDVQLDVPCNGVLADVKASFDVIATSWLGAPPDGEITVAGAVACPTSVALTVDADDPDDDIASVRWKLDGVLLDAAVTAVEFTQSHELTAVLRDGRGATTTLHKHVECE
jgi:hypothetical protein